MKDEFLEVFVDDVNLTSSVVFQPGTFAEPWRQLKVISFPEPSRTATIAFKGFTSTPGANSSGLMLCCGSNRLNSPWEFTTSTDPNWVNVLASDSASNSFPLDWFSVNFTGPMLPAVSSMDPFALSQRIEACPAVPEDDKIAPPRADSYFTFRRTVVKTCTTAAPTVVAPSSAPSVSPSTETPSSSPTSLAPTSSPSPATCGGQVVCCVRF